MNPVKSVFFRAIAALLLMPAVFCAEDISKLPDDAGFWETTRSGLQKKYKKTLVSDGTDSLYCPPEALKLFSFDGEKIYDLKFTFSGEQLDEIHISLYTRGDAVLKTPEKKEKEDPEEDSPKKKKKKKNDKKKDDKKKNNKNSSAKEFFKKSDAIEKNLTRLYSLGEKKRSSMKMAGVKVYVSRWEKKDFTVELSRAVNEDKSPEYITVDFIRSGKTSSKLKQNIKSKIDPASLVSRLQKEDNSTYMILPMIDQGQKGYCVPSTIARVLAYYGSDIELHALAGMMGVDPKRGITMDKTIEVLEKIDSKIDVEFKMLYTFPDFAPRKLNFFIKKYNSLARRKNAAELDISKGAKNSFNGEIFTQLRSGDPWKKRFFTEVRRSVDHGIPLCWGTIIFPQKKGGACSYHLRLIVGYSTEPEGVVFSDSWGKGHERNIENLDEAWGRTMFLFSLTP